MISTCIIPSVYKTKINERTTQSRLIKQQCTVMQGVIVTMEMEWYWLRYWMPGCQAVALSLLFSPGPCDQSEAIIQVKWSLSANQRQVSKSHDHSRPIRGQGAGVQPPECLWPIKVNDNNFVTSILDLTILPQSQQTSSSGLIVVKIQLLKESSGSRRDFVL